MAFTLEQVIARLQYVHNKSRGAHNLIGRLEASVAEHKFQLADARRQLAVALRELQTDKDVATVCANPYNQSFAVH